ncbi:sugar transferase [Subtercola sp. RTI3]|nr:sugar transferase [Subtercola sp. RTI3]
MTDLLVILVAVFGTQLAWFGILDRGLSIWHSGPTSMISYTEVSVILVLAWSGILGVYGSRGDRIIGTGSAEYKVVTDASLRLFGMFAIIAFLFQVDFSRGYFIMAFPLGTVGILVSRWLWRKWLNGRRLRGEFAARVVLVGSDTSVLHTARELARHPYAGYLVVAACVSNVTAGDQLPGTDILVFGGVDDVLEAMKVFDADTVVITNSDNLPPDKVRALSWSLEPGRQHLVVAPSLTDIGGPRIHTRPVAGLPLIHVETARYEGYKRYQKRLLDVLSAGALLLILSPVFFCVALVIRLTSPGDIFFRQERVGLNGSTFSMLKFRSMVTDAEAKLKALQDENRTEGNSILFKMKDDPRITPIGKVLRRFSLDELPQLLNVVRGDMSLVGPRPPLQREVDLYESHVHRRFLMKPGITGLWQVSGRSNLSWEDSVRLDLYYVENWSMLTDLQILFKTARAVLGSEGAY